MRKRFAALLMTAFAVSAQAAPSAISAYVHAQTPVGAATVTYAFLTVYDAALWSDARPFTRSRPFALTLTYGHDFSAKNLIAKTLDEMRRIDQVPQARLDAYGDRLARLWPDVKSGDTITAIGLPDGKTLFYYNGAARGAIDDAGFTGPFFDIWLSPQTSEPKARQALLHQGG